jgi:hypothetical protein
MNLVNLSIAERLEKEQLHEAYNLSRACGEYNVSEDIAELMYCPCDEYQGFRESIIKGLKGEKL